MYVRDIVFFQDAVHFGSIEIILQRKLLLIPNPRTCNRNSYDFKPKAAQMLQIGITLKKFGPKAAQMLKIISFILISDHNISFSFSFLSGCSDNMYCFFIQNIQKFLSQ